MLRYDPAAQGMVVYTLAGEGERQRQREAAAEQLIDYIAGTTGSTSCPSCCRGLRSMKIGRNWRPPSSA